jgi:hypothetical protein
MNRQRTVQESRHRLARAICHGGRGQIRQAYREGQEDQLASLGLVLNAVALWNTRDLDAAAAQLRTPAGHDLKGEDVARRGAAGLRCALSFGAGVEPCGDRSRLRSRPWRHGEHG